ncbi:MAG: family 10 glycosylhydrolase [Lentisphaeria bacterium]|nr:family 10 glycosylhydrolase [Lentisphaeria bacterium]
MKRKFHVLTAVFVFWLNFFIVRAAEPGRVILHPQTGRPVAYSALPNDRRKVVVPARYQLRSGEFRGIWIATYVNLDFPRTDSPAQFRKEYREALQKIRNAGFNAVFFQIRPAGEAFYNSSIHPFSRFIRGQEGSGYPQFDMLAYMIGEAHRQGLSFHAWLNPYRVTGVTSLPKMQYLKTLSPKNFARQHPELVLSVPVAKGNTLLLDPGSPQVRQHLLETVREIIRKYNPDSIDFDDYFYPYDYNGTADLATYRKYNRNPKLSLEDWRRENVNRMVRDVSSLIRENNRIQHKNIRFGISPFGIWRNSKSSPHGSATAGNESYSSNYSDTRLWVKNNWIDYIIPQLYWKFSHPKAPYAALADWWADTVRGTRVKLYIGTGAHQYFEANNAGELKNQLLFNLRRPEISGVAVYSYRRVFYPETRIRYQTVNQIVRDCWRKTLQAKVPNR